jgi:hypothetical protein
MKNVDYAQTYSEMSDDQLAQLVSEGRDSLNDTARDALEQELKKRGLTDELLAQEHPPEKPQKPHMPSDATHPPSQRLTIEDLRLKGIARPWQIAVIVLTLASTVAFTVMKQREAKLDQLYRTVTTGIDSARSSAALNELLTYRGRYALGLVLRIATTRNMLDLGNSQIEAIRVLGERGDAETAEGLAGLLRPYQGLAVREAVASSLLKLPCFSNCIRLVLDYRERIWRGEPSVESILGAIPEGIDEQRLQVDRKLDRVLLDNKRDTLAVLVQTYGLREITVSPFALHLVGQLNLKEACSLLAIDKWGPAVPDEEKLFLGVAKVRQQISVTRQQLNCDGLPSAP